MIRGTVTDDRIPVIELFVDGKRWKAQFIGHLESALAAGQTIVEENFIVEFPFDGETLEIEATFAPGDEILIGTSLLWRHRLEIDFVKRFVQIDRSVST